MNALTLLNGYKTYIVAVAAIAVGFYLRDDQLIVVGLGLAGLRHGLSTEVAKVLEAKDMKAQARKEALNIIQDMTTQLMTTEIEQPVTPSVTSIPMVKDTLGQGTTII